MGLWPQFRSPLVWDVFAVSTYATVSLLFWYVGLIPDLATLRDRAQNARRRRSSTACWRWAGAARRATGTATRRPTCCWPAGDAAGGLGAHGRVSFDFAVGIVPGWHSTIFPPYFVAGAIFSGFAMVLTLAIPLRSVYGLEDFITDAAPRQHGQGDARDRPDRRLRLRHGGVHGLVQRQRRTSAFMMLQPDVTGPYAPVYWIADRSATCIVAAVALVRSACGATSSLLFVISHRRERRHVAGAVRDHRRSACTATSCRRRGACTTATIWDWSTFLGTIGLFLTLLFLFIRFLPVISIFEMRALLPEPK